MVNWCSYLFSLFPVLIYHNVVFSVLSLTKIMYVSFDRLAFVHLSADGKHDLSMFVL